MGIKVKRQIASNAGKAMGTLATTAEGVGVAQAADKNLGANPDESNLFEEDINKEIGILKKIQENVNAQYNIYIDKIAGEGTDTIKIGDLIFSQAREVPPPTAIRVDKQFINHKWQALRTEQAKKAPSGHANARISLTVLFVGQRDINQGLRRLIATFKAVPFVPVENSFLRSNLSPNSLDVMAFSLVSMSVRTMPQMPTTLAVDLDLLYFNYKPYAPNFWMRRGWDSSLNHVSEHVARKIGNSLSIVPIISQAEQTKAKSSGESERMNSPTKRDPSIAYTTPTVDPSESRPWQMLVDRQEGPTVQELNNTIKIKYRVYKAIDIRLPYSGEIPISSGRLVSVDTMHMDVREGVKMKMSPEAASSLEALAADFHRRWGKKLEISSCFRTRQDQQKLLYDQQVRNATKIRKWKEAHPGQEPPPAFLSEMDRTVAKNGSWHECGLAVDIPTVPLSDEEWLWLVQGSSHGRYGFSCLGKRGEHANANKGQWETWHFDFLPGQAAAREKHNNNTQQAIAYVRSHLYYSDQVDENGDTLTEERMKQEDSKYIDELKKAMKKLSNENWTMDQNASTGAKLVFYQEKIFTIQDKDKELVPQGITITKHNIIAEIPILGHQYSTHQYLGSTDMEALIVFSSVGERKLRELQGIIELSQNNSRKYRSAKHSLSIEIDNSVFNLMGFNHGLFEGITAESVNGSPGLYTVGLQITQFNQTPPRLSQEKYMPSFLWKIMAQYVFENMISIGAEQLKDYLNARFVDITDAGTVVNLLRGKKVNGLDDPVVRKAMLNFFTNAVRKKIVDKTTHGEEQFAYTNLGQQLLVYAIAIGAVIESRLHPTLVRSIGLEGAVPMIELMRKLANTFPLLAEITGEKTGAEISPGDQEKADKIIKMLKLASKNIISSGAIYDDVFAAFRAQYPDAINIVLKGSPCYPDLDLPPHPMTGNVTDTAPDFWFYNESIDGALLLPSMRLEALSNLKRYAEAMYDSMREIGTKDYYDKFYISYNKPQFEYGVNFEARDALLNTTLVGGLVGKTIKPIEKDIIDKNNKRALKGFAGAFFPGESGLGLDTSWEIEVEKIEKAARTKNNIQRGINDFHLSGNKIDGKPGDKVEFGQQKIAGSDLYEEEAKADKEGIQSSSSTRLNSMLEGSFFNMDQEIYRMARAYPTFRVEFIEDDSGDYRGHRNFDDFYSYSAIKDIRVVRSRKIPSDLCVITIINDSGELDNIVYGSGDDDESSAYAVEKFNPYTIDTKQENPFSKLVLMEGSKIRVKLGYNNDPEELETVFNGQVVSIGVSDISPDIIQIVCQSYAVELVSELKNEGEYANTQELLSCMICQPEMTHFGRWQRDSAFDPAEIRTSRDNQTGHDLILWEIIDKLKDEALKRWSFENKPQDDNIFAPTKETYSTYGQVIRDSLNRYTGLDTVAQWIGIIDDDRVYHPRQVTTWDIFKEMELRHPGFIASPVPYGTRMTMFFGPPNHRYWSRPMNRVEMDITSFAEAIKNKMSHLPVGRNVFQVASSNLGLGNDPVTDADRTRYKESVEWIEKNRYKRYKPFRNYHYLSTEHNIIANNISASAHNTFNAVHLGYMEDVLEEDDIEINGIKGMTMEKAIQDNLEILECKADDNIEDKDTRVMTVTYPSCYGTFNARRYAAALLARSLRDVYKGTIYITGNETMKPYDMCYIYDTYRDMYGPVEVEQVTHIFSRETGFITEIKPDMCVSVSDYTTQCTTDAMWQLATDMFFSMGDRNNLQNQLTLMGGVIGAGAAITAATGGVGLAIAAMGGYKITQWTQLRQPLVITPLTMGYKPFIAGIHGYKNDQFFVSIKGRLRKWWDDVEEGWNVLFDKSIPEATGGWLANRLD